MPVKKSKARRASRNSDTIVKETGEVLPPVIQKLLAGSAMLSELLPGDQNEGHRRNIVRTGMVSTKVNNNVRHYAIRPTGEADGEVLSIAAVVSNPGATDTL